MLTMAVIPRLLGIKNNTINENAYGFLPQVIFWYLNLSQTAHKAGEKIPLGLGRRTFLHRICP